MHEDYRFVDFWIQGQKTIKSSLMGLVLMTSGAKTRKSWHNITSKNILLSDHCSLGHLFVDPPPTTHRASGGPTKKMCLRKSVFIIICPPPLAHHTLYCYLQSRHSTKCNVLTQQGGIAGFGKQPDIVSKSLPPKKLGRYLLSFVNAYRPKTQRRDNTQ